MKSPVLAPPAVFSGLSNPIVSSDRRAGQRRSNLVLPRIVYDSVAHSRDRLLNQLQRILESHESPLLIGSLGRSAALGTDAEFVSRGETVERDLKGMARDIDLFIPNCRTVPISPNPFPVDTSALIVQDQRVAYENGDYWLIDDLLHCAVRVDADVFTPHRARLLGELEVDTFSIQTHYALLFVIFDNPRKYENARSFMRRFAMKSTTRGSAELYKPFSEFHALRRRNTLNHARSLYRRTVPLGVRCSFHPIVRSMINWLPRK